MYRWIWQHLPAGRWRSLAVVVLVVLVFALLWFVVFPLVTPWLPVDHVTAT